MKTKADARPGCSANHPTECEAVARLSNFKTSPINAKCRHPDPPVLHPGVSRPPDPPSWGAATQNPTRSIFGVATPPLVGFGKSSPLGSGLLTSVFVLSRPPALQFYCLLPCVYYSAILLYPVRFCSHIFSGLVLSPLCPTSIPFPSLSLFLSLSLSSSLSLPLSLSLCSCLAFALVSLSLSQTLFISSPYFSPPLLLPISLSSLLFRLCLQWLTSASSSSLRSCSCHLSSRPTRPPARREAQCSSPKPNPDRLGPNSPEGRPDNQPARTECRSTGARRRRRAADGSFLAVDSSCRTLRSRGPRLGLLGPPRETHT